MTAIHFSFNQEIAKFGSKLRVKNCFQNLKSGSKMKSNSSKANASSNDNTKDCECKNLGKDGTVKQSADEPHVPCMKSSKNGSDVSK